MTSETEQLATVEADTDTGVIATWHIYPVVKLLNPVVNYLVSDIYGASISLNEF